jgi:hypothetical protein
MRQATGKYLLIAAVASLMLPCFVSDTGATTIGTRSTIAVKANISFAQVADVAKQSDVTVGVVTVQPRDRIMIDNYGAAWLEGKDAVFDPTGHPSMISIGDARNQTLNVVTDNYTPGDGISALRAHCTLKGTENANCDALPFYGKKENALFIGMEMTVADGVTAVDNSTSPSFDMSVVYQ